jgi:hypothetical protein
MSKNGKQFEMAVYEFLKALTPNSIVHFDYKVQDRDTGQLRQTDAWIETKIGNHIPLSILISCKDYKRKLNVSHIETFSSEIESTSASTGVIYSSSGFSAAALEKAKAKGINCCQLFCNKPSPLPPKLSLNSYVCKVKGIELVLDEICKQRLYNKGIVSWEKLFKFRVEKDITLLDAISRSYLKEEREVLSRKNSGNMIPQDWESIIRFSEVDNENETYVIKIRVWWAIFKGKTECHLFEGSYCFTDENYRGSMRGPVIDTHSFHPGPDWVEVERGLNLPKAYMTMIFSRPNIKEILENHFRDKNIS